MPNLLVIYLANERNIEFGIETRLWGMHASRSDPSKASGDDGEVKPGTVVLLLTGYQGKSIRPERESDPEFDIHRWAAGPDGEPQTIDAYIAVADSRCFYDESPHWPDEKADEPSAYPFRFHLLGGEYVGPTVLGPPAMNEALLLAVRKAAITIPVILTPEAAKGSSLVDDLLASGSPEEAVEVARGESSSQPLSTGNKNRRQRRTQAFGRDHARNTAVESRAVEVATDLLTHEWSVRSVERDRVGYDLLCSRTIAGVEEKLHIEVKGSSGDIEEVLIYFTEMEFALDNPETSRLIVVKNIEVRDDPAGVPVASGGVVAFNGSWENLPGGTTAITLKYRF